MQTLFWVKNYCQNFLNTHNETLEIKGSGQLFLQLKLFYIAYAFVGALSDAKFVEGEYLDWIDKGVYMKVHQSNFKLIICVHVNVINVTLKMSNNHLFTPS